jgi:predicted lipid-binding transport protein (Tim44 family)
MSRLRSRLAAAFGVALALGVLMADPADARRGGSFGSRGYRTYSQPRPTATSPGYTAPVQRSMTPNSGYAPGGAYAPRPGYAGYGGYYRPSPFGGFGGGFLGGLVTGGLIGGLMGHGWGGGWGGMGWGGGGGGLFTMLIQLVILGFIVSWVMRMFRRRQAYASPFAGPEPGFGPQPGAGFAGPFGGGGATTFTPTTGPAWEIPITPADQADFERLLREVQDCYAREDYAGLRERCTPEIMGYLAEELSDNATHGRKNDVRDLKLLQADVGEAWREGPMEYATASMRYESIDVMRDRQTAAVISGDADRPTQTTELWTFVRPLGGAWKLSAIQET